MADLDAKNNLCFLQDTKPVNLNWPIFWPILAAARTAPRIGASLDVKRPSDRRT
ncbi:hypothetical protein [Sphingopyxis sp.]|uniref:hypothetical protein n=1 Tax=Sphingopyxis sp. TaxID=1908224 RepID=UPI002B470C47|nr:hypothetical protein [Sphingopyxis sp.]